MTAVSTRLVRLLNMVPYFQANPKITYAEAASDLGVSVKQLASDLGYASVPAFSHAFRQVTGKTPTEFAGKE